jgi:hypothetical protein
MTPLEPLSEATRDFASSMPWWVRAVAIIGIPGVLVIYLVWMGAQEVPSIRRITEQNGAETIRSREMIREQSIQIERTYRMIQRVCSNTAKTDEERLRCFDR